MEGIYTYIPATSYVSREYSVAAILLLLFMVLISLVSVFNLLYFYISTSRSVCAVPNMAVFWSSLTSCFPGMLILLLLLLLLLLLMQLSCHSVAVVLTLVQAKQIRINVHKRNNQKTQYKQYNTQ
jgi:hypothetical protein